MAFGCSPRGEEPVTASGLVVGRLTPSGSRTPMRSDVHSDHLQATVVIEAGRVDGGYRSVLAF